MSGNLGDFLGTWRIVIGESSGDGETLTIEKSGRHYSLVIGGESLKLEVDLDAFTLKNDEVCLSLWRGCNRQPKRLFGIRVHEDSGGGDETSYGVWGAEKVSGGDAHDRERGPKTPDWRVGQWWKCRTARSREFGLPPFIRGNTIGIRTMGKAKEGRYKIFMKGQLKSYDTLSFNRSNRTLDGKVRSVALWDRREWEKTNFIFAMFVPPPAGAQGPGGFEEIKDRLMDLGALSFEAEILAHRLGNGTGGIAVWGAEEGEDG